MKVFKIIFFKTILKVLDDLINILIRNIGYLFLIIDGKQVNTCIRCFNNNIERNNSKAAPFSSAFTLNTKSDFAFSTSKGDSNIRILHQLISF